jgi:hypothetical protein
MNGEIEAPGGLGAVRVVAPHHAARTRAGLAPGVRAKLDQLESDATNALALVRAVSDRVAEMRAEVVAAQQRMQLLTAASGITRPVDLGDERAELADAEARLVQLSAQRVAAEARWQAAAQVFESCRHYLDLA